MFKWLKRLVGRPDPLPPLGFEARFLDAEELSADSVFVVIENDDKTPMDFVVQVLEEYFLFDRKEAVEQMLKVHVEGEVEVRAMVDSDAARVVEAITGLAAGNGYPLKLAIRQRKSTART